MLGQRVIRAVLFVVFFGIGAATLASSILCEDLAQYYWNKQLLSESEDSLNRLRSLNTEYDELLEKWEQDPNFVVERVARATLGPEALSQSQDSNTVYPRATAQLRAAARRALDEDSNSPVTKQAGPAMPRWLIRCRQRPSRITLFACGVILILTSFVCFRPEASNRKTKDG
ncbi:MAG: hypothetical protein P8Z79_01900 [Sedimentisphaerales bacterium]|jgi:hypothetical protein